MRPSSGKPQTVSCFLFVLTPVPSAALHSCYKTFKVETDLATAQQNLEVLRQVVRRQSGNAVHTKEVQSVPVQERRTVRHPLFNAHRGRLPGLPGRVCPPRLRPRIKNGREVKISRPTRPPAHHPKNITVSRYIYWGQSISDPPQLPPTCPKGRVRGGRGGWGAYFCIPRRKNWEGRLWRKAELSSLIPHLGLCKPIPPWTRRWTGTGGGLEQKEKSRQHFDLPR